MESRMSASYFLFAISPDPAKSYPLSVDYCSGCGLPLDLCSKSDSGCVFDEAGRCPPGLGTNKEDCASVESTSHAELSAAALIDGKKRQTRGGKGMPKPKKATSSPIHISKQSRKGNKMVTIVKGLPSNGVDLDAARKFFAQKYSCGCSKSGDDELTIQGDVGPDLAELIPQKWPNLSDANIVDTT